MRFGTIRHRQEAPIYRIAFTRDDKFIVTDGDDSQLRVWDGHDGKLIRKIAVGIDALDDFALTSDGKTVATTGINLVRGQRIRPARRHSRARDRTRIVTSVVGGALEFPEVALDADRQLLGSVPRRRIADDAATTGVQTAAVVLENEDIESLRLSADRNRLRVVTSQRDVSTARPRVGSEFSTSRTQVSFDPWPSSTSIAETDSCRRRTLAGRFHGRSSDGLKLVFLDVASGTRKEFERARDDPGTGLLRRRTTICGNSHVT